jgi:PAS domain S-box-containing protein
MPVNPIPSNRESTADSTADVALRSVLDALPDAVFVVASDDRIVEVNAAAVHLSTRGRNELLGLRLADIAEPADAERDAVALESGEVSGERDWILRRRDGSSAPAKVSERRTSSPGGPLTVITVRDRSPEQSLRLQAERTADHLARLRRTMLALTAARSAAEVAEVVMREGLAALGAQAGSIAEVRSETGQFSLLRSAGYSAEVTARWSKLPAETVTPFRDCGRRGVPVWIESRNELAHRYPEMFALGYVPYGEACACLPLRYGDEILGIIGFVFAEKRSFSDDERRLFETLANQCTLALQRTRLAAAGRAARAATELERIRLQQVLAHLPEAVTVVDSDGRFTYVNQAAIAVLGVDPTGTVVPRGEKEGYERFGVRRPDGSVPASDELPLQRAFLRGETVLGESLIVRNAATGRDIPILNNAAPIRDQAGAIAGAVSVFQDVTYLRKIDDARKAFYSSVTHDLLNPLGTIRATVQLVQRQLHRGSLNSEELHERLSGVIVSADRMRTLLDALSDLARLQVGEPLPLERRPVDLNTLVWKCVVTHRLTTDRHQFEIIGVDEPFIGQWDEGRLTRVIDNLLGNAVKYSPDGGTITVSLDRDEAASEAVLSIHDTGMGIPAEALATIFEPYQRASNVAGRIPGQGIGLFSARQIVEQHAGRLAVESAGEGQGTRATVFLPLDPPAGSASIGAG